MKDPKRTKIMFGSRSNHTHGTIASDIYRRTPEIIHKNSGVLSYFSAPLKKVEKTSLGRFDDKLHLDRIKESAVMEEDDAKTTTKLHNNSIVEPTTNAGDNEQEKETPSGPESTEGVSKILSRNERSIDRLVTKDSIQLWQRQVFMDHSLSDYAKFILMAWSLYIVEEEIDGEKSLTVRPLASWLIEDMKMVSSTYYKHKKDAAASNFLEEIGETKQQLTNRSNRLTGYRLVFDSSQPIIVEVTQANSTTRNLLADENE
jgi:glutaredoxin 2